MKKLLRPIRRVVYAAATAVLGFPVRLLPVRVKLVLKRNSEIIRRMDYARHDIYLNIESRIENEVRLFSCAKEPETVEWIETFFQDGDVFYDVGANVGAYSLVASSFCRGKIQVYAFEPGFLNFPQLCKNVLTNSMQQSITPMQVALSNTTGMEVFNYENLIPGGAIHTLGEPVDYKGDQFTPVATQRVFSYRADDLISQFNIPAPTHIKIDVDGIELDVLKGAHQALSSPALKTVLLELEDGVDEAVRITKYLEEHGLVFHSRHKFVYGGETGPLSGIYNYIFQRQD